MSLRTLRSEIWFTLQVMSSTSAIEKWYHLISFRELYIVPFCNNPLMTVAASARAAEIQLLAAVDVEDYF